MIIGIDHIALNSLCLEKSVKYFSDAGYKIKFVNNDVPNPRAKIPFVANYDPLHSIAFCQSSNGIAVELIQLGALPGSPSGSYFPVFNNLPKGANLLASNVTGWNIPEGKFCQIDEFSAIGIVDKNGIASNVPDINRIVLPCRDLAKSHAFWQKAGFRDHPDASASENGSELHFRAIVPQWNLRMSLLRVDKDRPAPMLDSPGFPCLALLTTNIDDDLGRLAKAGNGEFLNPFNITVNGKTLRLAMLRGPDREILELIQFNRE